MKEKTLAAHLAAKKAETLAWVAEDPANRWATYPVQEVSFWAERGIHTVAHYERHDLEASVWDVYKSAYGIKPRWMDIPAMSDSELESVLDGCYREMEAQNEREARAAHEAMLTANKRALARRKLEREFAGMNSLANAFEAK